MPHKAEKKHYTAKEWTKIRQEKSQTKKKVGMGMMKKGLRETNSLLYS